MATKENLLSLIQSGTQSTKDLVKILKQSKVNEVQIAAMEKIDWSAVGGPEFKLLKGLFLKRTTTLPMLAALKKSRLTNEEIVTLLSECHIRAFGPMVFDFLKAESSFDQMLKHARRLNENRFWSLMPQFAEFESIPVDEIARIKDAAIRSYKYFDGWTAFLATGKLSLDEMLAAYTEFAYWERSGAIALGLAKMDITKEDAIKYYLLFDAVKGDHKKGEILAALMLKGVINEEIMLSLAQSTDDRYVWKAFFKVSPMGIAELSEYKPKPGVRMELVIGGLIASGKLTLGGAYEIAVETDGYFCYESLMETYALTEMQFHNLLERENVPSYLLAQKFPWEQTPLAECLKIARKWNGSDYFYFEIIKQKTLTLDELNMLKGKLKARRFQEAIDQKIANL